MDVSERILIDAGLDAIAESERSGGDSSSPRRRGDILRAVAASSRGRAHNGWPATASAGVTPLAAFLRTASELSAFLDSLSSADWKQPTAVEGATVRELMVHLVGVERYVLGQLGRGEAFVAPTRADHYPVTRRAAADVADAGPPAVSRAWWLEVMRLVDVAADIGPDREVGYHHLTAPLRGLLVVRTFELWTHDDDIRRAVGRPPNQLDGPRLGLMSSELMTVLPLGMALQGRARSGRSARFVLTGAGGGTYDVGLAPDQPARDPDVVIGVATVDLCRLAANRLAAGEIDLVVEGDPELVEPILVGAAAFAAD